MNTDDLYQPLTGHKSDTLGSKISIAWENELRKKIGNGGKPSLLAATTKVFGWQIAALGLMLASMEFFLRYVII